MPAFARAAAEGRPLQVCGRSHTFDFTPLEDTVRGLLALVELLDRGETPPPPIHFATGRATTLQALAELAVHLGGRKAPIVDATPRDYDVAHFVGDASRARALLGWEARIDLTDGLRHMIEGYRAQSLAGVG